MAQTGYTPLLIYASGTTGNTPSAANLTSSASGAELAINYFDGKLFYKDNAGVVQVLATKGTGAIGGSNTQVQYNSSGALAGSANLTFDGTTLTANALTVTNNPTFSGGTANGVVYLNGSKVATSGSALTFDGNALTLGGATPRLLANMSGAPQSSRFGIQNSTTNGNTRFFLYPNGTGTISAINGTNNSNPDAADYQAFDLAVIGTTDVRLSSNATGAAAFLPLTFYTNGSEQMRLTSTGLGIGTSSPSEKLTVNGNIKLGTSGTTYVYGPATNGRSFISNSDSTAYIGIYGSAYGAGSNSIISFVAGTTNSMTFDASGNLGLGVTPSAWNAASKVLQIGSNGTAAFENFNGLTATFYQNSYRDSAGTTRYITSNFATRYFQFNGQHAWEVAPSGTAGNAISFTQAMTLDASGNLLVNTTSSTYSAAGRGVIELGGGSTAIFAMKINNAASGYVYHDGTVFSVNNVLNGALAFATNNTERARITSGGDLLVGTTTATIYGVDFRNRIVTNGTSYAQSLVATDSVQWIHSTNTSGNNLFINFVTEAVGTNTVRGSIDYNRAGGLVAYNTTSDYRAKDIIGPVQNPGATIDALKVYEGVMKGATQSRPMLIAHEAQAHAPYAVSGVKDEVNEDGTPKFQQMDVSSLVPLLLAEIQSLRARVQALEAQP